MKKDPRGIFVDPVNPTQEEISNWAYGDYYVPMQDFELFVTDDPYFILELAIDPKCPTRDFFLSSLYTWIGDTVRSELKTQEPLEKWLNTAEKATDERILKLVMRARNLIANPHTYSYQDWGLGAELART